MKNKSENHAHGFECVCSKCLTLIEDMCDWFISLEREEERFEGLKESA